jgi:hypothetical protein
MRCALSALRMTAFRPDTHIRSEGFFISYLSLADFVMLSAAKYPITSEPVVSRIDVSLRLA